MAKKVILPKLGQTMEEGSIVEWIKQEGDEINRGDVLFTLESDKAVLEVEARNKGVLRKILLQPGVAVPVMAPVGIIGDPDEDISAIVAEAEAELAGKAPAGAPASAEAAPQEEAVSARAEEVAPAPAEPVRAPGERLVASPRARRVAREKDVDLAFVEGSGPGGRVVEKDVLAFMASQPAATPLARRTAEQLGVSLDAVQAAGPRVRADDVRAAAATPTPAAVAPAPAAGELVPLKGIRAIVAQRMAQSHDETAPISLFAEVDATAFVALRTQLKDAFAKELGFSIGYNDILAYIVARCLREFPYMNVRLEDGGIRYLPEVNIGMAVDSERGLLVPVLRRADEMTVKELAVAFRELVARAREGRSQPDDLSGGTFTITNLGMYGVDFFTAMINLPEAASLSVGRIREEPAGADGQIAIRSRMGLGLTVDHRLVDGAPAARFLQAIVRYIENPYLLLA